MDPLLEQKLAGRRVVELLVIEHLIKFGRESSLAAVTCVSTGKMVLPDLEAYARKIISTVKEHSL